MESNFLWFLFTFRSLFIALAAFLCCLTPGSNRLSCDVNVSQQCLSTGSVSCTYLSLIFLILLSCSISFFFAASGTSMPAASNNSHFQLTAQASSFFLCRTFNKAIKLPKMKPNLRCRFLLVYFTLVLCNDSATLVLTLLT